MLEGCPKYRTLKSATIKSHTCTNISCVQQMTSPRRMPAARISSLGAERQNTRHSPKYLLSLSLTSLTFPLFLLQPQPKTFCCTSQKFQVAATLPLLSHYLIWGTKDFPFISVVLVQENFLVDCAPCVKPLCLPV